MSIRYAVCIVFASLFFSFNHSAINAQIAEEQQAHVVFDLRLDKLREYTDVHGIELNEMLHEMTGREFPPEMIADVTRVFGAIQLPADEDAWRGTSRMLFGPREVVDPERQEEEPARRDDKKGEEREIKDPDGEIRRAGDDGLSNVSFRNSPRHQDNVFPVNFFIRIKFRNETAANAFGELAFANADMEDINGKSFARPGGGAPD
ncbi:MAG: hypothetical protein ACR2NP_23065, partial [Pirellulaceae bacterium]